MGDDFILRLTGNKVLVDGFLRVTEFRYSHSPLDPQKRATDFTGPELVRVDVFRRDAVAGLLHMIDLDVESGDARQQLFFVEQMRFSTLIDPKTGAPNLENPPTYPYTGGSPPPGVLRELMAGVCGDGESALEAFMREATEETGFVLDHKDIVQIGSFFPSPGACSERIHLFYGRVRAERGWRDHPSYYGYDPGEDIRRCSMPAQEFLRQVENNEWHDAKALAAAEWMRRPAIWKEWFTS